VVVLASPSERPSVFGSAGKEATVAPNGVVVNAVHPSYQQRGMLGAARVRED
jgi:hypothetical protein